ncbi:MAG: hypothetical protein ACRC33_22600 [Gemmataceae bacterium]
MFTVQRDPARPARAQRCKVCRADTPAGRGRCPACEGMMAWWEAHRPQRRPDAKTLAVRLARFKVRAAQKLPLFK